MKLSYDQNDRHILTGINFNDGKEPLFWAKAVSTSPYKTSYSPIMSVDEVGDRDYVMAEEVNLFINNKDVYCTSTWQKGEELVVYDVVSLVAKAKEIFESTPKTKQMVDLPKECSSIHWALAENNDPYYRSGWSYELPSGEKVFRMTNPKYIPRKRKPKPKVLDPTKYPTREKLKADWTQLIGIINNHLIKGDNLRIVYKEKNTDLPINRIKWLRYSTYSFIECVSKLELPNEETLIKMYKYPSKHTYDPKKHLKESACKTPTV